MTESARLHPTLQAAWDHCDEVRTRLLAAVTGVSPSDWTKRTPASEWTLADQVDHLIRTQVGTSKMARKMIRGDFQGHTRPPQARFYDSSMVVYPFPPGEAPAPFVPKPAGDREALLTELAQTHQRFAAELARFEGPNADAIGAPDGDTYWFTLGGWVRMQALHEDHHLKKIREMLG